MSQHTLMQDDQQISSNSQTLPILIFSLEKQRYGLQVTQVVRIIEMVTIVQVHDVADYVQGIINYQSTAVPVIDMRARLGFDRKPYGLHTPIILMDISDIKKEQVSPENEDSSAHLVGLIVDDVQQVVYVPPDSIKENLPKELSLIANQQASYLEGITTINRQLVLLLNIGMLLKPDDYDNLNIVDTSILTPHTS